MTTEAPLRVCYFGTYRAEYSRNRIMIEGLRSQGVEVCECQAQLWQSIEERVDAVKGSWRNPAFFVHVVRTYGRLLARYWSQRNQYDVMVVGYPGQFDVFLARLLSWWQGKPLVWDIFMSIYLIAVERGLDRQSPTMVGLLRRIERWACRLPDRLILDTAEYVKWFQRTHGVDPARFRLVPTGSNLSRSTSLVHGWQNAEQSNLLGGDCQIPDMGWGFGNPLRAVNRQSLAHDGLITEEQSLREKFQVIYAGTFIPNHGVPTIIEAAKLLADDPTIHFRLIGQGPDLALAQQLATTYQLTNLTFIPWLEQRALLTHLAEADLCLGVFGTTPQSLMTVQNKIYEALALGKPVLSGDGPAVRQALVAGEEIYLCPRQDAAALAAAIRQLQADPTLCQRLATQGQARFQRDYTTAALGQRFKTHLYEVMANR